MMPFQLIEAIFTNTFKDLRRKTWIARKFDVYEGFEYYIYTNNQWFILFRKKWPWMLI